MSKRQTTGARKRRQVAVLMLRDGNLCHYCEIRMTLNVGSEREDSTATRDHVIPKCMGGLAMLDNFVLACNACNNKRGNEYIYCNCEFCTNCRVQYEAGASEFVRYSPNDKINQPQRKKISLGEDNECCGYPVVFEYLANIGKKMLTCTGCFSSYYLGVS